jgi:hypothetical protein
MPVETYGKLEVKKGRFTMTNVATFSVKDDLHCAQCSLIYFNLFQMA